MKEYQVKMTALHLLQRLVRGHLGRLLARSTVKGSHRGKSAEELSVMLAAARKELTEATTQHQYQRCAELDEIVRSLERARAERLAVMPPISRVELDIQILALKLELETCVATGDFAVCGELTARADTLEELRKLRPTPAERERQVSELKTKIDAAAQTKDYAACGVLQQQLQEAEQALCDAEWAAAHGEWSALRVCGVGQSPVCAPALRPR